MTMYTKQLLSGSTNGKPIPISATAISSGTTVHTAVSGTTAFDEVYAWVNNIDSVDHSLTIGFGGNTTATLVCDTVDIPANSPPIPILTGQILQNGLSIVASSDTANMLNLTGFVNRIM